MHTLKVRLQTGCLFKIWRLMVQFTLLVNKVTNLVLHSNILCVLLIGSLNERPYHVNLVPMI